MLQPWYKYTFTLYTFTCVAVLFDVSALHLEFATASGRTVAHVSRTCKCTHLAYTLSTYTQTYLSHMCYDSSFYPLWLFEHFDLMYCCHTVCVHIHYSGSHTCTCIYVHVHVPLYTCICACTHVQYVLVCYILKKCFIFSGLNIQLMLLLSYLRS